MAGRKESPNSHSFFRNGHFKRQKVTQEREGLLEHGWEIWKGMGDQKFEVQKRRSSASGSKSVCLVGLYFGEILLAGGLV